MARLKDRFQQLGRWVKKGLTGVYENSPQAWAARNSEAAQIRAEQRERDYNSPKAQMERYKEAGLNPALMYGGSGGGGSGNVGSSAPQTQAPSASSGGIMQYILQGIQMGANIATVASQSSLRATQREVGETVIGRNIAQKEQTQEMTKVIKENLRQLELINPWLASIANDRARIAYAEGEVAWDTKMMELRNLFLQSKNLVMDGQIKSEILKGKEINNVLLDAEKEWVTEGDFTSKQFWQVFLSLIKK